MRLAADTLSGFGCVKVRVMLAVLGAVVPVLYGIIPTLQPANFGRVYAAYGGVFVVLSILWGWQIDKIVPDKFDLLGGIVALAGVTIIMYAPSVLSLKF